MEKLFSRVVGMRCVMVMAVGLSALGMSAVAVGGAGQAESKAGGGLRDAANGKVLIGTAVMAYQLQDPVIGPLVSREFNCLTAENEMKPEAVQREKGVFTFEAGDKLVAFAEAHGMKVVGHNLCWHNQMPRWNWEKDGQPLSREEALANLKAHIDGVAGHYKGKVVGWDVVNEAIDDGPGVGDIGLRNTPALKAIGEDYIAKAFEFAAAADPSAELYYNDYSNESGQKLERTLKLIRSLKKAGVKIDGVGMQGHWMMGWPSTDVIDKAIKAYAAEGVKVMITELDVDVLPRKQGGAEINAVEKGGADPYKEGLTSDMQDKLAKRYGEIFDVLRQNKESITRVTLWGTHDGTSWLNNYPVRGRTNHALLWDREGKEKPAYTAVKKELEEWGK